MLNRRPKVVLISSSIPTMTSASSSAPASCKNVVLDAGPLLSLSPLRGLAQKYWTVPQVLDELKDRRAREHFEQLGLSAGVAVEVRAPSGLHLTKGRMYAVYAP
jgi:hypothetical protein